MEVQSERLPVPEGWRPSWRDDEEEVAEDPLMPVDDPNVSITSVTAEMTPISQRILVDGGPDVGLTTLELRDAIRFANSMAGRCPELLFFDVCYQGAFEVLAEMHGLAEVMVASPVIIPGPGWDYREWLTAMKEEPPEDASQWARQAVKAYENTYRAQLEKHPLQLAAFRTESELVPAFAELVEELREFEADLALEQAWEVCHGFGWAENIMVLRLVEVLPRFEPGLADVCQRFTEAFSQALVARSEGGVHQESPTGLTLWCPRFGDEEGVSRGYERLRFAQETGWLDYMLELLPPRAERPAVRSTYRTEFFGRPPVPAGAH